jgi:hypothetical protein
MLLDLLLLLLHNLLLSPLRHRFRQRCRCSGWRKRFFRHQRFIRRAPGPDLDGAVAPGTDGPRRIALGRDPLEFRGQTGNLCLGALNLRLVLAPLAR